MRDKLNAFRPFLQSVFFQCAFGLVITLIALVLGLLTKTEWPFLLLLLPIGLSLATMKR